MYWATGNTALPKTKTFRLWMQKSEVSLLGVPQDTDLHVHIFEEDHLACLVG